MNKLVRFIKKPSVKAALLTLGIVGLGLLLSEIEKFVEITFGGNTGHTFVTVILALMWYFAIYSVIKGKKHD